MDSFVAGVSAVDGAAPSFDDGHRISDTPPRPRADAMPRTGFSVFDLDRTLTRRGTYSPFLLHCAMRAAPWRLAFVPVVLLAMLAYKLKLIDRAGLKNRMQRLMLGRRIARAKVAELARSFALRCAGAGFYEEAFLLVALERAEGREVVLATAAHRFYAEALAARLSIGHVVATESRWDGDMLVAEIAGDNCYGAAKRDALAAFLTQRGVARTHAHVRFYSDDLSDLPSFEWADQPFAINPSRRLSAFARARRWPLWRWGTPGSATPAMTEPETAFAQLATA